MTKNTKQDEVRSLSDLTPDPRNANRGTERGAGMLEASLREFGAGRSLLVDKHGVVIAGNKTLEAAASIGLDRVRVVETDGTELIVVQRTDLDLAKDVRAKALGVADNRVSQVDLQWDVDTLASLVADGTDLSALWHEAELSALINAAQTSDLADQWDGMPEFDQKDKTAHRTLQLHFPSDDAVQEFAKLIGQKITDKTRFVWYPNIEIETLADKRYASETE